MDIIKQAGLLVLSAVIMVAAGNRLFNSFEDGFTEVRAEKAVERQEWEAEGHSGATHQHIDIDGMDCVTTRSVSLSLKDLEILHFFFLLTT